jgi:hypothetical protein
VKPLFSHLGKDVVDKSQKLDSKESNRKNGANMDIKYVIPMKGDPL